MKKLCLIMILLFGLAVFSASAADLTETVTFEWDQEDTTNLKEWRLYWGDAPGGPYAEQEVALIPYPGSGGPSYSSPAEATVSGEQGSTVTKHFVLVACGDIPQEGGGTAYSCSENSNEVSHGFFIPAGRFSVPVNFKVIAQ